MHATMKSQIRSSVCMIMPLSLYQWLVCQQYSFTWQEEKASVGVVLLLPLYAHAVTSAVYRLEASRSRRVGGSVPPTLSDEAYL
ncbi:uncharacterized protein BO72DRAFT_99572 [Aspergillus fijiensis CBS 313.89]|uniref:Uncharacterized protein n=1 Tax=Aspergillus fijiensis CBS 313.89 TaxID=1448319 RepID=A0A8G1RW81_9EURO|nr:uncharacterized protein BO72DRAFT_99572 [Aspergillus fijiensis CBS 313.89]RAK77931.1 hypothetical protein BO72DRAFT_99572 [Aspergillus fijiensis CBS 313.89]